jgi:hypothetical protein
MYVFRKWSITRGVCASPQLQWLVAQTVPALLATLVPCYALLYLIGNFVIRG